jgi:hypothetical protein
MMARVQHRSGWPKPSFRVCFLPEEVELFASGARRCDDLAQFAPGDVLGVQHSDVAVDECENHLRGGRFSRGRAADDGRRS